MLQVSSVHWRYLSCYRVLSINSESQVPIASIESCIIKLQCTSG